MLHAELPITPVASLELGFSGERAGVPQIVLRRTAPDGSVINQNYSNN